MDKNYLMQVAQTKIAIALFLQDFKMLDEGLRMYNLAKITTEDL